MRGNSHVRCGAGENPEITSKDYLSLYEATPHIHAMVTPIDRESGEP